MVALMPVATTPPQCPSCGSHLENHQSISYYTRLGSFAGTSVVALSCARCNHLLALLPRLDKLDEIDNKLRRL
jgi:hypothetical protein